MNKRALTRRRLVQAGVGGFAVSQWPGGVLAKPKDAAVSIAQLFGERPVTEGRVEVVLPKISENGYSVPLSVTVDSPMTAADHVVRIAVFAEENPLADVVYFNMNHTAGVAKVRTRIRMGGSQKIRAVAEMNRGSLWSGSAFSIVTLAACVL